MVLNGDNPHGGDVYRNRVRHDFSINVNPLGTPEPVREAVRQAIESVGLYPDAYCEALRRALSAHEQVPAARILCGNGAAELIYTLAQALRPRRALVVAPTFCEYERALQSVDCAVDLCALRAESGFRLDIDALAARLPGAALCFVCNPNNPTGRAYPREQMERLLAACEDANVRLFVDECFVDLTAQPARFSLTGSVERHPGLFVLKAFTKSYHMAGLRLGYALCADEMLLARMTRQMQPWNVSSLAQQAGIAALGCADYLDEARAMIRAERDALTAALRGLGLTVFDSDANFLLLRSDRALYEPLLARGILIRRCGGFTGLDERYFRCAVKSPAANRALIQALEDILHG